MLTADAFVVWVQRAHYYRQVLKAMGDHYQVKTIMADLPTSKETKTAKGLSEWDVYCEAAPEAMQVMKAKAVIIDEA